MKQTPFKEYRKKLIFPAFLNYRVVIIVSTDKDKTADKLIKKYNLEPVTDFAAIHIWIGKIKTSYLIFPKDTDVGTMAHESWHCARQIISGWAGGELDNEIVAYHLGYITQEVYNFIHGLQ